MTPGATVYPINHDVYLPAGTGEGRLNSLPTRCDQFIYLEVSADLTALGFGPAVKVYVPCYFPIPREEGGKSK